MGTCFGECGAENELVLFGLAHDEGVALSQGPHTTSNSRTWCSPQWAQIALGVRGSFTLSPKPTGTGSGVCFAQEVHPHRQE